ncbi:MAG: hypothetical protein WCO12_02990 [bacterium]
MELKTKEELYKPERFNKIKTILGIVIAGSACLFGLVYCFVMVQSPNESFARDILGFKVPTPPLWTSYIPFLGVLLSNLYQLFSIHGIVGLFIFGSLISLALKLTSTRK